MFCQAFNAGRAGEIMSDKGVINLSEFSKNRRVSLPAGHIKLLHESRDMFAENVMRELSGQLGVIEGGLIGLATNSPLRDTRETYSICLSLLQRQSTELMQSCKQALIKSFDAVCEGGVRAPVATAEGDLTILDENEYEVALALDKSSSRLRFNCAEELIGLDARMGVLLERPKIPADDNPIGPKLLCESLLAGMNSLGVKQKVQLVLLNQFDLALYQELPGLYQEINRFLVAKGVMPDFKAGIGPVQKPVRIKPAQAEETELLNLFDQLAKAQPAGRGGQGGLGPGTGPGGASLLGISMLEALGRLQIGTLSLPTGVTIDLRSSLAGGFPNVVRELQQSPAMLAASQVETVMIDAVAMLFDYLFEDRAIPDHLKQLVAQLQVPVLKAAIIDRGFFTNREHPARRVLDLIASLAVQPDGKEGKADPLLTEVEAVIEKIVNEYDQDTDVFLQAVDVLSALQARREQELEAGMADNVAVMQREERAEVAEAVILEHIRRALAEQPAPESVALFLRDHWAGLLKLEYIEEGESSPHLSAHMETMRELLWSVQNKADMDSRLMLVRILPGLLKRLREGAGKAGMLEEDSEKFFSVLVALHAGAVRASSLSVPLPEAETILDDLPEQGAIGEAGAIHDPRYEQPLPDIQDEFSAQAGNLQKGDRLEMHNDDGSTRWVHVVWVSGLKGNYLLSDANGQNMFSISPQRLAEKLRSGQAKLLGHESATESAFSKLVSFFKQRVSAA
jgi:hypothetical protein